MHNVKILKVRRPEPALRPLAFVLIGAVPVATALTLPVLPALYALWLEVAPPVPGPAPRLANVQAQLA